MIQHRSPQTPSLQTSPGLAHSLGPEAALARAVTLHMEGHTREAFNELEAALQMSPNHSELLAARGHLLCELGHYDQAVKSYSRLFESGSVNPVALYNLAVCLEKLGR
jgi:Tfp pilus assembly protein PilF